MAKCIVCRQREAELPDRNRPGRPTKRICRQCHGKRLLGDLRRIIVQQKRRLDDGQG